MKFSLENIIKFCLIAGVGTIFIWKWSFRETFIPKPSEFFFAVALLAGFFYFCSRRRWTELRNLPKTVFFACGLLLVSLALASFYGWRSYGISLSPIGMGYLLRVAGGIGLFLLTLVFFKNNPAFKQKIYFAFFAPVFILAPLLFAPSLAAQFHLMSWTRFMGLGDNPITAGRDILIGFSLVLVFFLGVLLQGQKQWRLLLFLAFLLAASEMLLMWTQVRSAFGVMWLAIAVAPALAARYRKKGIKKTALAYLLVGGISALAFLFSPSYIKTEMLVRSSDISSQVTAWKEIEPMVSEASRQAVAEQRLVGSPVEHPLILRELRRFVAPYYYFNFFREHPLSLIFGLGVNYGDKVYILKHQGATGILDVVLFGGLGALAALAVLGFLVLKKVWQAVIPGENELEIYGLGAAIALLGIWSVAVFHAIPLPTFSFWILLAMALAPEAPKTN